MSVYVDPIRVCLRSRKWPYTRAAHLFADSVEELHAFAASIGLKRTWFQHRHGFPHYDVTGGMRWQAIRHGALAITHSELSKMRKAKREEQERGHHNV